MLHEGCTLFCTVLPVCPGLENFPFYGTQTGKNPFPVREQNTPAGVNRSSKNGQ